MSVVVSSLLTFIAPIIVLSMHQVRGTTAILHGKQTSSREGRDSKVACFSLVYRWFLMDAVVATMLDTAKIVSLHALLSTDTIIVTFIVLRGL